MYKYEIYFFIAHKYNKEFYGHFNLGFVLFDHKIRTSESPNPSRYVTILVLSKFIGESFSVNIFSSDDEHLLTAMFL